MSAPAQSAEIGGAIPDVCSGQTEIPRSLDLGNYLKSNASPLIVVAHPDDEALGVGARLAHWTGARFVHVTDGAPRNMRDALATGCTRRKDYAALRRKELEAALSFACFSSAACHHLNLVDQEAATHLPSLTRDLAAIFQQQMPETVITHPYEGGHPDHDSVAFSVSCACKLTHRTLGWAPVVIEMTSYHNHGGLIQTGEFLFRSECPVITARLTEQERDFKRRLLSFYATQSSMLTQFQVNHERFRLAPRYDFSQPPDQGTLFYEQYGLGMDGNQWRGLAAAAMSELGLGS